MNNFRDLDLPGGVPPGFVYQQKYASTRLSSLDSEGSDG
jgi:hypothetical protein